MRATGLVWGGTVGLAGCGDGERDGNGREDVVGAAVEEVEGGPESIDAVEEEIAAFAGEVRSPERFALECRAARAKDPRWAWSWRKVAPAGKAPKLEAEAERWKDFPDAWLFPDERPVIWKELPDKE